MSVGGNNGNGGRGGVVRRPLAVPDPVDVTSGPLPERGGGGGDARPRRRSDISGTGHIVARQPSVVSQGSHSLTPLLPARQPSHLPSQSPSHFPSQPSRSPSSLGQQETGAKPSFLSRSRSESSSQLNNVIRQLDTSPSRQETESRQIDRNLLISPSEITATSGPEEVIVREAFKEDNHIVIKWESETTNILGFRVVYRLFGKPEFKQGPPLAPSEREFRIKNVPANVSVCSVLSLYS